MGYLEMLFNLDGEYGEQRVCCPLPHLTQSGVEYYETTASASVNLDKRVFHCSSCGMGYTEIQLAQKLMDITYANACRWVNNLRTTETLSQWCHEMRLTEDAREMCEHYNISMTVAEELHLAGIEGMPGKLLFPVFYNDKLLDIRTYQPSNTPKMLSRKGSISGMIVPFDLWKDNNKTTIICAGEKDMATTRSHNLNAITITGGELSTPFYLEWFRGRKVAICYDNDDAGIKGAKALANKLLPYCTSVKVCTKFHEICVNPKEDLTDYWNKYNGTRHDLIQMIMDTPEYIATNEEVEQAQLYETKTITEMSEVDCVGNLYKSDVQVIGAFDQTFIIPTAITVEKKEEVGNDRMYEGEIREWELTNERLRDILGLCDGNITDEKLRTNLLLLAGVHPAEKAVKITTISKATVYKATIADASKNDSEAAPGEVVAYVIGTPLTAGKSYTLTHTLVTHPSKGQQLHSVVINAKTLEDAVDTFKVTEDVAESLNAFKDIPGTVEEKINTLSEKVKGVLGYDGNNQLITTIDLAFHTVLNFNFSTFTNVRGYLDTLIVGESRVGKSSTADCLRKLYGLGSFVSLAGNSATIPALVGGTNKMANGQGCTKAGVIPQNHKGLIIFEEFGKCDKNVIAELTDIRSSNEVRIQRVSGSLTLPAVVRMITLSNVKPTSNGDIRPINSYPNGIAVATELVPTAEDIARYDVILISADKGNTNINPLWQPATPMTDKQYKDRIRWIWSRKPEQVLFTEDAKNAVVEFSNTLNERYDCHIKIFGTECWKKLCRLAIAVAGYVCNTDTTYENIVVDREHVAYAANFMVSLYINDTFRLKEYVRNERKYIDIDDNGVAALQELYIGCPQLLIFLDENASATKSDLDSVIGLSKEEATGYQSALIRAAFIQLHGTTWVPTVRFRKGMKLINRECSLRKLGEV